MSVRQVVARLFETRKSVSTKPLMSPFADKTWRNVMKILQTACNEGSWKKNSREDACCLSLAVFCFLTFRPGRIELCFEERYPCSYRCFIDLLTSVVLRLAKLDSQKDVSMSNYRESLVKCQSHHFACLLVQSTTHVDELAAAAAPRDDNWLWWCKQFVWLTQHATVRWNRRSIRVSVRCLTQKMQAPEWKETWIYPNVMTC